MYGIFIVSEYLLLFRIFIIFPRISYFSVNLLFSRIFIFFQSAKDPDMKIANEKFLLDFNEMPDDILEGVERICADPKFAFVYFNNDLFLMKHKCWILQIPKPIFITWDAFRLRVGSTYVTIFNRL